MSKVYFFVLVLLSASFSGCLSNEPEAQSIEDQDEETIEPVGTGNNDTEDYDELITEIANLTDQIEELNEQIEVLSNDLQSLEYYQYNPSDNSTISIYRYYNEELILLFNVTKNGNVVYLESMSGSTWHDGLCTSGVREIIFYTSDMSVILSGSIKDISVNYEKSEDCIVTNNNYDDDEVQDYFNISSFELKQEPVRISIEGQTHTF